MAQVSLLWPCEQRRFDANHPLIEAGQLQLGCAGDWPELIRNDALAALCMPSARLACHPLSL